MLCTHRINPACGIPRFLSRFARRAGLVHLRQTFVLRCHGDDGWPLRAEASSNLLFGGAAWRCLSFGARGCKKDNFYRREPVKVIEIIRTPQIALNRPVAARCNRSARFRTIQI